MDGCGRHPRGGHPQGSHEVEQGVGPEQLAGQSEPLQQADVLLTEVGEVPGHGWEAAGPVRRLYLLDVEPYLLSQVLGAVGVAARADPQVAEQGDQAARIRRGGHRLHRDPSSQVVLDEPAPILGLGVAGVIDAEADKLGPVGRFGHGQAFQVLQVLPRTYW